MIITEEEKLSILEFYKSCNEMIEGRFILSDTKVANILKCIVKSDTLYNLYSVCMKDFKFKNALDNITHIVPFLNSTTSPVSILGELISLNISCK